MLNRDLLHEFTDERGIFKLNKWRNFVNDSAAEIDDTISALCPFGFELTGERNFLTRDLRRFYVYLSQLDQSSVCMDATAEDVCMRFVSKLQREAPVFYSSLDHVVYPRGRLLLNPDGTRLLRVGSIAQPIPMLDAYSLYILACPQAIVDESLREVREFDSDDSARRYMFQLMIILSHIYSEVVPPDPREIKLIADTISNLARYSAKYDRAPVPASSEELQMLRDLIFPFATRILEYMIPRNRSSLVKFHAVDIHSNRPLIGEACASKFIDKFQLIKRLYSGYPAPKSELSSSRVRMPLRMPILRLAPPLVRS